MNDEAPCQRAGLFSFFDSKIVLAFRRTCRIMKHMNTTKEEIAMSKTFDFAGYRLASGASGLTVERQAIDTSAKGDHGADPVGDGTFRMVPSGDIVSYEERCRRLKRP